MPDQPEIGQVEIATEEKPKSPWRGDPTTKHQQKVAADAHMHARVAQHQMKDAVGMIEEGQRAWNEARQRREENLSVQRALRFSDKECIGILAFIGKADIGQPVPSDEERRRGR